MELGCEWEIADFRTTLHDICHDNSFCWIDQLCIDQTDDAEIRTTLLKIPDIYRSFDVVVLFPGKPCSCYAERLLDAQGYIAIGADPEERMPAIQDMTFSPSNLVYGQ